MVYTEINQRFKLQVLPEWQGDFSHVVSSLEITPYLMKIHK